MHRPKTRNLELKPVVILLLLIMGLLFGGCEGRNLPVGTVRLELESRRPRRMAEFYLGAYGDSAEVSKALGATGQLTLALPILVTFAPSLVQALEGSTEDGVIDREEFAAAVMMTYAAAIGAPPTLDAFREIIGWDTDAAWVQHEVSGSMTRFRRRMFIRAGAVRNALLGAVSGNRRMIYEPGTQILGEHFDGTRLVETTAMIRRQDGFWDYFAYDSTGSRVNQIQGTSDPLAVPIDCFGCHYGTRLFEPERSFPEVVGPGPFGERGVFVPASSRGRAAAIFLDEHRRRTDGLLGLYGTIYLSELIQAEKGGRRLEPLDSTILAAYHDSF